LSPHTVQKILTSAVALLLAGASAHAQGPDSAYVNKGGHNAYDYTKNHTGSSISTTGVGEKGMNKGLVGTPLDAFAGKVGGVSVSNSSNGSSASSRTVQVHGTTSLTSSNEPLVILDGVMTTISTLNALNPSDIESYTVLGGAEAAQYGSRGASGVIVVRTKKGKGGRLQVSYDGTFGVESATGHLDVCDAEGYRQLCRSMLVTPLDKGGDSDFQSEILRTGTVMNHHVALAGNEGAINYRASLGVQDHRFVVRNNSLKNYTAKVDITQMALKERLTIDLGMFGSRKKTEDIYNPKTLYFSTYALPPTWPSTRNSSGSWDAVPEGTVGLVNPMAYIEADNDRDISNLGGSLNLSYRVGEFLRVIAQGAYTLNSNEYSRYLPSGAGSNAYRSFSKTIGSSGTIRGEYDRKWGSHAVKLSLGSEVRKDIDEGFNTTVAGFGSDEFSYNNLKAGSTRAWNGTSSFYSKKTSLSFMGKGSYAFSDRYFVTLSLRADASSVFGENHKWGFFPSVNVLWDVKKEDFLCDIPWVTSLKVSAGVGQSGSQAGLSPYLSLSVIEPIGLVGGNTVALGYTRNANPDLKWEVRTTYEAAASAAFLEGRISSSVKWYLARITDMLYQYSLPSPPYTFSSVMANLGSMKNTGLTIELSGEPIRTKDLSVRAGANLTFQKSVLLSLSGEFQGTYLQAPAYRAISSLSGPGVSTGDNGVVYQIEGQSVGAFYLPHCVGLTVDDDGSYSYKLEDIDGDGTVNIAEGYDRRICGQAMPKAVLSSSVSIAYRNFDLSVQAGGAFGHKIFNATAFTLSNVGSLPFYNTLSNAGEKVISDQTVSDYWLEKGDYLCIDYISLGWKVPLRQGRLLKGAYLSFSINNLAMFTSYSGLTPKINSDNVNSSMGVDEWNTYPSFRTFSLGVKINF